MPKKNLAKKKSEDKKTGDEMLKELAIKLKSSKEEDDKVADEDNEKADLSELEEDVESGSNNLENFRFRDFAIGEEVSAPVLERIASSQQGPVFFGRAQQTSGTAIGNENEQDSFKYAGGNNRNNEPKYIDSDSHLKSNAERIDINRIGRDFQPGISQISQEAMFMQSPEARADSQMQEKTWNPERMDFEREKRKNPLEREETKYDKYKPDLPKSR